ncbi:MAG TPA: inositol monophosphatase family protein [Pusillimonas sp.]|uniref:inositol monophosphatase family protein n=1 Tax=Pusillimonas sp. TaxID=3040095 RepID=UPI002C4F30EE|nr:inositol monophosphatase family protein [Pusillimonas sp.]HUH87132.1 inositol monophosphatase family protein [Pusillimonas sp.]
MHPMLNTAIKAARRAGSIINRAGLDLERLQVARKGPKDYVTEVDHAVEAAIIDVLRTAYPDHAFLGEETGAHPAPDGKAEPEYQWIIDPLDGTTNFIHGFPVYAVSIALAHRGQVTQAVIFDPSRNELFTASRGGGAFLNDRRIRVSGQTRYHDALIGAHVPRSASDLTVAARFSDLLSHCASARRMGATVLDLAYVASGRIDGFCGLNLKRWDMAAGSLLVLEAGGLIGDFEGEQGWMQSGSVLAASPKIFTQMLAHLQG